MAEKRIIGIHISERINDAVKIQDILTKFGCSIKTRIGLHDVSDDYCSPCGLVILELTGDINECDRLEMELEKVKGVVIKKMTFNC